VPLTDKTAVATLRVGKGDWLVGEVLADRGEAVVLEPADLRPAIAKRAGQLLRELKLTRVRVAG
jgi:predicted DNA-binding transcriptional regulator YafY